MEIEILELIDGARQAKGAAVVIDVFRAFTLESYLLAAGAEKIYPIADLEEAFALKAAHPEYILFGERGGARIEGCDFGNAPSDIRGMDFAGKTLIHTTSAGTQGLAAAAKAGAGPLFAGALTTAKATARCLQRIAPVTVSLVAMGNAGTSPAGEDRLCAEYLRALLTDEPFPIKERAAALRYGAGAKFFDPDRQAVFPMGDFPMCVDVDCFDFAVEAVFRDGRLCTQKAGRAL